MTHLRRLKFALFLLPVLLLFLLISTPVSACCKHIGNVGPYGGGVGLWGFIELAGDYVENAIVTISIENKSVSGCTYLGEGNECPVGVTLVHSVETEPYYAIEIGGLYPGGITGLPLEPITLNISVIYTDTVTAEVYEVIETITLSAADFNEYKEVRLDISLYPPTSQEPKAPTETDFQTMTNVAITGNTLKLVGGQFLDTLANLPQQLLSFDTTTNLSPYPYLSDISNWEVAGYKGDTAGDVNCDGYGDVIIYKSENNGQLAVYYGGPTGLPNQPGWFVVGDADTRINGGSTAGDFNGDGCADIMVNQSNLISTNTWKPQVGVYFGSPAGLGQVNRQPNWFYESSGSNSVGGDGSVGDVNGDNFDDILIREVDTWRVFYGEGVPDNIPDWGVGADDLERGGDINGDGFDDVLRLDYSNRNLYLHLGSSQGLLNSSYSESGIYSATYVGDVNYDGYSDFITTNPSYTRLKTGHPTGWSDLYWLDNSQSSFVTGDVNGDKFADILVRRGYTAELFLGKKNSLASDPNWTCNLNNLGSISNMGLAGDVNGDGFSDFLISQRINQVYSVVAFYGSSAVKHPPLDNWSPPEGTNQEQLGYATQIIGDITGDGLSEIAVSAPFYDGGNVNSGRVLIYAGSTTALSILPMTQISGEQAEERFGSAIAGNIDLNCDGYNDFIIGAPGYNGGQGRLYIYYSNSGSTRIVGQTVGQEFGKVIATLGDVNGDGCGDFAVGIPNEDQVFIFLGNTNASNINLNTSILINGYMGSKFGSAIVGKGDVNGDGLADVLIGGPDYVDIEVQQKKGGAWLYLGSHTTTILQEPFWHGGGTYEDSKYGSAVTLADINGDGFSDIVVGAYKHNKGAIFDYPGHPTHIPEIDLTPILKNDQWSYQFGYQLQAGNFNNDGYQDIVVSDPLYTATYYSRGLIYTFYGTSAGLNTSSHNVVGTESNHTLGYSLGSGGDVNGDGNTDVIIGSPNYLGNGKLFFMYGSGKQGGLSTPQQLTISGELLPMSGVVDHDEGMACQLTGGPLIVSDTLQLICEFAPINVPFGAFGSFVITGTILENAAPNTTQTVAVGPSQLEAGVAYKWRARWVYRSGNWMGQKYSPWYSPAWNGQTEADFRTAPGDITVTILAPSEIRAGTQLTAIAPTSPITIAQPIQYDWKVIQDGQIVYESTSATLTYTPTQIGQAIISLQITDALNQTDTDHKPVLVKPYLEGIAQSQLITPNVIEGALRWDSLKTIVDIPTHTTMHGRILDTEFNPILCVPPFNLRDGLNLIPLSCIDPMVYPSIRFEVTLSTSHPNSTPSLNNWNVHWLEINAPTHKIAGQAKDGYGHILPGAKVMLYSSGNLVNQTTTNQQGWYEFDVAHTPDISYTVRVELTHNKFSVQHNTNGVVYLESEPFYLNHAHSIFTTKIVNVNFLENQINYTTNIPPERLDDLAVIYYHSYQAVEFIQTELQEPGLPSFVVKAFDPALTTAEYEELSATIRLGREYSSYNNANRPMNREWHEIFHHLMKHTVGSIPNHLVCTPQTPFQNHGGYFNACTSDSWSEGWAEFWATVLANHLNWGTPGMYHMGYDRRLGPINLEVDHPAWEGRCNIGLSGFNCYHREEFAVASTLWDLYDDHNDNRDQVYVPLNELWAILKQSHLHDMKDVYGV